MPISIGPDRVLFAEQKIRPQQFTDLVAAHLGHVLRTTELEGEAARLCLCDFESLALSHFIHTVCTWGGYSALAYRIEKANDKAWLQGCFRATVEVLTGEICDIGAGLQELNRIKGLGRPSFASKHLRFLRPQTCPVLDSVIASGMCYEPTVAGYRQWAEDAIAIARFLERSRVTNPMGRADSGWFAADVDMAVYAYLNGW